MAPSVELAKYLGAKIMIVFGFRKTEGVSEDFVDKLGQVAEAAKDAGIVAVIELLSSSYTNSGQAMARIIKAVGSEHLRINWDAGNVNRAGFASFPDEYEHVRGLVAHCHLKNHTSHTSQFSLFDRGDIDLKANIVALERDGYNGLYALETHTRWYAHPRPLEDSEHNMKTLKRWSGWT